MERLDDIIFKMISLICALQGLSDELSAIEVDQPDEVQTKECLEGLQNLSTDVQTVGRKLSDQVSKLRSVSPEVSTPPASDDLAERLAEAAEKASYVDQLLETVYLSDSSWDRILRAMMDRYLGPGVVGPQLLALSRTVVREYMGGNMFFRYGNEAVNTRNHQIILNASDYAEGTLIEIHVYGPPQCKECKGSGVLRRVDSEHVEEYPCGVCGGKGKVRL